MKSRVAPPDRPRCQDASVAPPDHGRPPCSNIRYRGMIEYHNDQSLRKMFTERDDDTSQRRSGVLLCRQENLYIADDVLRFPGRHPVLTYALVFTKDGFMMATEWQGDFFPHVDYRPFTEKDGKLAYISEERGSWELSEAFPNLSISDIGTKLETIIEKAREESKK